MTVRRLAAIDMWGTTGTGRRRQLIRAEFVIGALGCTALGVLALQAGGGWLVVIGVWLIGAGVNYVPLALHAHSLSRRDELEQELRNTDIRRELRRASLSQLWIAVPFAVAAAAASQLRWLRGV